jgi:hypothetical protein
MAQAGRGTGILQGGLIALALALGVPAAAQAPVILEGQVVERDTWEPLVGALVTLEGRTPVVTDRDGWFRFRNVAPGRHRLRVQGFGYQTAEHVLDVATDTLVRIELAVAPVPVPPVVARARQVEVRGVVREAASGLAAEGARVSATVGGATRANRAGRFRLREIPADVPVTVWVQHFGFLPVVVPLEAERDTTLEIALEPDPVAEAMIAAQMERIDRRAEGYRYDPLPVLEREDLLEYRNWLLHELIAYHLGPGMTRRIGCIVIDEVSTQDSRTQAARFSMMTPAEVHRVEVTEYPGARRALMLRVYTRRFVQAMVNDQAQLVPRELAMRQWAGRCR